MFVGVLRVVLHVPGARSLKDGRRVASSLIDRMRSRFDASVHEIEPCEIATRRTLAITTAGDDPRTVRASIDKMRAFVESAPDSVPVRIDADVFPWHAGDDGLIPDLRLGGEDDDG